VIKRQTNHSKSKARRNKEPDRQQRGTTEEAPKLAEMTKQHDATTKIAKHHHHETRRKSETDASRMIENPRAPYLSQCRRGAVTLLLVDRRIL
jgi:hypothetical protein